MLLKYLTIFIIIMGFGILYERYNKKYDLQGQGRKTELIEKYLLNNDTIFKKKPILWIHNEKEINNRNWTSFGSRSTEDLNQPYIILCLKSIINHCGNSFNICLIDDDSFEKLLPNWTIKLSKLPEPIKSHFRILAMIKILYYYGGMTLPNSTIVLKDLIEMYNENISNAGFFTLEGTNKSNSAFDLKFLTDVKFLGCEKNSPIMKNFMHYLERLMSNDPTNEIDFLGLINRWLHNKSNKFNIISGKEVGVKTKKNNIVRIEQLLSKSYINFDKNVLKAIYIPKEDILKRTKFMWFSRMSEKQIIESDLIISKYFVLSQIPM